jgi:hypothetical protein
MEQICTGRKEIQWGGEHHFAEVIVRVYAIEAQAQVVLSAEALDSLRSKFAAEFEAQRHNVWSAVAAHLEIMGKYAATVPHLGPASFRAEVISIELSADLGGDLPGYLLSVASMNAILEYFEAWKESQVTEEP